MNTRRSKGPLLSPVTCHRVHLDTVLKETGFQVWSSAFTRQIARFHPNRLKAGLQTRTVSRCAPCHLSLLLALLFGTVPRRAGRARQRLARPGQHRRPRIQHAQSRSSRSAAIRPSRVYSGIQKFNNPVRHGQPDRRLGDLQGRNAKRLEQQRPEFLSQRRAQHEQSILVCLVQHRELRSRTTSSNTTFTSPSTASTASRTPIFMAATVAV